MRQAGFTLVETLVALAVTAVLLAALATAVPTTLRANAAATSRLEQATAVRTLLLHLERELTTAVREPFVVVTTPAPRLEFTGGREPGERLVYAVERGALVRRTGPRFAAWDPRTRGVPVLEHVASLTLEAFDGREWVPTWQASDPPEAVRIGIRFADGGSVRSIVAIPTVPAPRRSS